MPESKFAMMKVRLCILIGVVVIGVGFLVGWLLCKTTAPPPPPGPRIVRFLTPNAPHPPLDMEQEKPGDPDPIKAPVDLQGTDNVKTGSIDEASTNVRTRIDLGGDPPQVFEETRDLTKIFVEYCVTITPLPDDKTAIDEYLGERATEEEPWVFQHWQTVFP